MIVGDELKWLERWYERQCDGDWEHQRRVQIETLDNPGWRLTIDLRGTALSARPFQAAKIERTKRDWLRCWVEGEKFEAATGPLGLSEAIAIFRQWVET